MARVSISLVQKLSLAIGVLAIAIGAGFLLWKNQPTANTHDQTTSNPAASVDQKDMLEQLANDDQIESPVDDGESECIIDPPGPLVDDGAYADYRIQKSSSSVEESMSLKSGAKLKVTTTGCEDFATVEFEIDSPLKDLEQMSALDQLKWLRTQISELSFRSGDYYSDKTEPLIANFTKVNPEKATGRIWVMCNDGSIPPSNQECDWDKGGAVEFETKSENGRTRLIFRHYYSV